MAIEDKLAVTRFNINVEPHIRVDTAICADCKGHACLYVCPVQNYKLEDGKMAFTWQGCLECGACRIACTRDAIAWDYPRGGFGVCWRYG
jgi:ferredoxin like protein